MALTIAKLRALREKSSRLQRRADRAKLQEEFVRLNEEARRTKQQLAEKCWHPQKYSVRDGGGMVFCKLCDTLKPDYKLRFVQLVALHNCKQRACEV